MPVAMLNQTRAHPGIARESQFEGPGIKSVVVCLVPGGKAFPPPSSALIPASLIGPSGSSAFRTIHQCSVDVARGPALLSGIGTEALPPWDQKNEEEQSKSRPCC